MEIEAPTKDEEALNELPRTEAYCRVEGQVIDLRAASWSYQPSICAQGATACPIRAKCSRVAQALNRPGQ